jgi:PAS domain S-box-containing protein
VLFDLVVAANERSARLFGFADAAGVAGANSFDLVGPIGGKPLTKRRCLNGAAGLRDHEHWLGNTAGLRVPVELSTSVIRDRHDRPAALLFMLHDITRLKHLEKEHRAIFEATGDGMVVYTMEGEILAANPAFCAMNGYTCDELVGQNVAMLVHPDMHDLLREFIKTIGGGESFRTRATNVRKDGSVFPVDVHGTVFEDEEGPRILGVARDVTEEVNALELLEQRVAERTRELLTVLEIAHDVASVLDLEPLLNLILDQLKIAIEYRWAALLRIEDEDLVLLAGAFGAEPTTGRWVYPLDSMGPPWAWDRLRRGEPIIVDDVTGEDPLARAYREAIGKHPEMSFGGEASWMAVPLMVHERMIGAITLLHEQPGFYTRHHAQLAQAIADQAAVAMENARLYERAQQTAALEERQRLARELHDAVTQTLFSASLIADVLPRLWARDQQAGMERLEDVRALTRGALAEMRTLLLELRPTAIVEAELSDLLRQLAEVLYGRSRLPVTVEVEGQGELPADVKLAFYRVAQEALNNADKHAAASHIDVRLNHGDRSVALSVKDDGKGFDPRVSTEDGYAHFGLVAMRERAKGVGATVSVRSQPGAGTEVRLQWNKARQGETR